MPYELGDIVLVRFPFTNQTTFKQRPAVVVSSRGYKVTKPDVVIMAITSRVRTPSSLGEVRISQWQPANLSKPSAAKPVFAAIEQNLILKKLGALDPSDQVGLRQAIAAVLS